MSIEIFPIDFIGQGALLEPADRRLHDKAVEFCKREIVTDVNLTKLAKAWVAIDTEEDVVLGVMGYVLKPDIPIMRAVDAAALSMMAERLQAYFADQGLRGGEVFVHVSKAEKPEQKCPGWYEVLRVQQKAVHADRFSIKVR